MTAPTAPRETRILVERSEIGLRLTCVLPSTARTANLSALVSLHLTPCRRKPVAHTVYQDDWRNDDYRDGFGPDVLMRLLDDLKMYGRFGFGLKRFLHEPITVAQAAAAVRSRLATREDNFLRLLQRGVFEYPRSPYLPLFRLARCEFADVCDGSDNMDSKTRCASCAKPASTSPSRSSRAERPSFVPAVRSLSRRTTSTIPGWRSTTRS